MNIFEPYTDEEIKEMDNSNKIILDLCGGAGAWSKPYKDAGYDVRLVTLPDNNVLNYIPPNNVYGVLCAPPCTELSIAKDHKLARNLKQAMQVVNACLYIINICNPTFWALENPAGKLSQFLGEPQFSFQPYEFGDPWTKRTLIWGTFNKPVKLYKKYSEVNEIAGLYKRPNRKTVSIAFNHKSHKKLIKSFDSFEVSTDADFRAITPQGFAKAFYLSNHI